MPRQQRHPDTPPQESPHRGEPTDSSFSQPYAWRGTPVDPDPAQTVLIPALIIGVCSVCVSLRLVNVPSVLQFSLNFFLYPRAVLLVAPSLSAGTLQRHSMNISLLSSKTFAESLRLLTTGRGVSQRASTKL
jgi:hypothetical protein